MNDYSPKKIVCDDLGNYNGKGPKSRDFYLLRKFLLNDKYKGVNKVLGT